MSGFVRIPLSFSTDHNRKGVQLLAAAQGMRVDTGVITPLMHWTAFCFALAPATPLTFYYNGKKWEVRMLSVFLKNSYDIVKKAFPSNTNSFVSHRLTGICHLLS